MKYDCANNAIPDATPNSTIFFFDKSSYTRRKRYNNNAVRKLVSVVRNNIEIFATLAAIVAGALVPLPSPSGGDRSGRTVAVRMADDTQGVGAVSSRLARLVER